MRNKKTKRIITILLALSMVIGIITPAVFAEDTSEDVVSAKTNEKKIQELVEGKYITGYSDGTLGLERNISRAEFTAIVTRAMRLEDIAKSLQNTMTNFTDVDISAWYNGYVNVAHSKNLINGYPDGTFRPENNVKYEEAIAILVRMLLSPEEKTMVDNSGKWPMNYYLKADELGLLNEVNGVVIGEVAQREKVFLMLSNVIAKTVNKNTEEVDVLVLENNEKELKLAVLRDNDTFKEKDILSIKKDKKDAEKINIGQIYTIKINEKNKVTSLKENSNSTIITGEISKSKDELKIDGKNYGTDNIIKLIYNKNDKGFKSFPAKVDFAMATLYYGKLVYVDGYNFDEVMPIEEVKNNKIYGITKSGAITLLNIRKDDEIYSIKNGKISEIKLEEIKNGDIAYVQKQKRDTKIYITNEKIKGKVKDFDVKKNIVKINDKEYKIETNKNQAILGQGKRYFPLKDINRLKALKDAEVEASINLNGNIQFVKANKDISVYTKAVIEEKDKDRIYVLTENGYREYFYITEATELIDGRRSSRDNRYDRYMIEKIMSKIEVGDVVKVLVDGRGDVEEIQILQGIEGVISYIDWDVVEVDKRDQYLSDDFVIFSNNGVYRVVDFYDVEDIFYKNRDARVNAIIYEDNRLVETIVIKDVSEGAKKELINDVKTAKEVIKIAEKYKENNKVANSINNVSSIISAIEANIDKLSEKEIETYKKNLYNGIVSLEKEVLNEILNQITQKLDLVEKSNKAYNEESYEQIKAYVTKTKALTKIDDYMKLIKEAEVVLNTFDKKVYESVSEFDKKLNDLQESLKSETIDVNNVLERTVYNNKVVDDYKLFLDRLKNEIPNINNVETIKLWENELNKRKDVYIRDRFNLEDKHENLVKVYFLEERITVAIELVNKANNDKLDEVDTIKDEITNATRFAKSLKNINDSEKIDINKVIEIDNKLRKALIDLAGRIDFPETNNSEIKNLLAEAEATRVQLIANGEIDKALNLNECILELKAYVYTDKAEKRGILRLIDKIESFLIDENKLKQVGNPTEEETVEEELINNLNNIIDNDNNNNNNNNDNNKTNELIEEKMTN